MEEKYFKYFDEDKIEECILGEGKYYLNDRDWQKHDRILVFHYIGKWAVEDSKKRRVENIFYKILDTYDINDKNEFYLFIIIPSIYFMIKKSF